MDLPSEMLTKAWVFPLIMAGSFLVILLVGKRLPEKGRAMIGIASVGMCFVLSLITAAGWIQRVDSGDAGVVDCGEARYQQPIVEGMAEHGDVHAPESEGGESEGGESDDHATAEPSAVNGDEQASGLAVGETAAPVAAAAEEGEEEHHSTPPVVCAVTWFESGTIAADEGGHGGEDDHSVDADEGADDEHAAPAAVLTGLSQADDGGDGPGDPGTAGDEGTVEVIPGSDSDEPATPFIAVEGEDGIQVVPGGDPDEPAVLFGDGLDDEGEAGEAPLLATGAQVEAEQPGMFEFGFIIDGLAVMMLITVSFISLLVHIYSIEYLHDDVRHTHYYAFLSLFTASMLFYVLSSNTLQMLMGWELVGLCSFGLIGHWWEEKPNSDAALKAFLTNRVGDMGLLIGVIITFFAAGATSFNVLHLNEYALSPEANQTLLLIGALCLFGGVTSKSGQFPLHTWLPDAMAGPTPVSALIHAATMVVAGVYLIARLYAVFYEGLNIQFNSVNYVAIIGGVTVVGGALLAFVQQDLKKVLAYSTISQLGYMVMALGVGAWTAGVFHLFTHAFFKACLFLGAGSVSHACHHTFDMREMGGLKKYMPTTFWTFAISTAALIGIFPLAGFWSKDEILAGASQGQEQGYTFMLVMGVIGAFCTAAYMTRAMWKTFFGEYRGHAHPHESPKIMTIPLVLLCVGAVTFGFLNIPTYFSFLPDSLQLRFEHYVEPTFAFPEVEHPVFSLPIALISTAVAALGIFLAYAFFALDKSPFKGLSRRQPFAFFYNLLQNNYYLDWLYTDQIAAGSKGPVARAAYWINQHVIDQVVNAVGVATRLAGDWIYRYVDQGAVDKVVNASGAASEESGQLLRRVQTGKVQQYAAMLFGGAVLFALFLVLFV